MKTKLFFSSEAKRPGLLVDFCQEKELLLTDGSLIRFEKLPFELNKSFDVVFFSSPRSVDYFLSEKELISSKIIACVGTGTAQALREKGLTPDFVGEKSGNPNRVASNFLQFLGNRTVVFPVSTLSNETISSVVPENQKIVLTCYTTLLNPRQLDPQDWYVFTSPSNVSSFLVENSFPPAARIIAWGTTTAAFLQKNGCTCEALLEHASEAALVAFLRTCIR